MAMATPMTQMGRENMMTRANPNDSIRPAVHRNVRAEAMPMALKSSLKFSQMASTSPP